MAVPLILSDVPNVAPYIQYVATNGQTVFPYPFPITQDADLIVVANGVTLNTDAGYTLSGQGNDTGGNVTFILGRTAGDIITLYRDVAIQRISQIAQNSGFSSTVFNAEYNNIYLILQQLKQKFANVLTIPNTNSPAPTTTLLPSAYASKYLAFDANGNPTPALLTTSGTLTAAIIAGLLNGTTSTVLNTVIETQQTVAEAAASVTPTVLYWPEGDIRRYGATTAAGDNHVAINNALLVSAAGGNAAFIPGGNWNITTTITAVNSCSMYGTGDISNIIPTGCDGLSFLTGQANYQGSRFFRDFAITGPSTTTSSNNGITINLASGKIIGIQFSNLTIQNFAKAVGLSSATGLWNSSFTDCFLYNNYQGYYLNGQAIVNSIRGGFVQAGGMGGAGTRYGVYTAVSSPLVQSLHLQAVGLYAYDVLVNLNQTVFATITDCDLSLYNTIGIQVHVCSGGTYIRGCWIQGASNTNGLVGIQIDALGSPLNDKIVIDSCQLQGQSGTGTGSLGIFCGENNPAISILNSSIGAVGAQFATGISGTGGFIQTPNVAIKFNTFNVTGTCVSIGNAGGLNIEVGPNTIQNGTPIVTSAGSAGATPVGLRYFAPGMKGSQAFAASTSAAVVFSGAAMPNASYFVTLGGNAAGFAWPVNKTTTGFTINCNASNSNATDWSISYF